GGRWRRRPAVPRTLLEPPSGEGRRWRLAGIRLADLMADLREIRRFQHVTLAQHDGAQDGVFELPDIAGPVIGFQQPQGRRRETERRARRVMLERPLLQELGQRLDVLAPL